MPGARAVPSAARGPHRSGDSQTSRSGRLDAALCVRFATALHADPSPETFYILDGELLLHVDGEERRGRVGDTVGIRRGVPHAFVALSDLARFLVLNTPGGHDRFFRAGGHPAPDGDFANAPPPDLERTKAAAERFGVELLGPAPFDDVRLQSG